MPVRRCLPLVLLLLGLVPDLTAAPRVGGWIDWSYSRNRNHPTQGRNFFPGAGTSVSQDGGPNLELVAVELTQDPAPFGFHLLLNIGEATDVIHAVESSGGGTGLDQYRGVTNASISWAPEDSRWRLDAGTFMNPAGFEAFASKENWNYTRSWMADLSPYFLTGLQASYQGDHGWSGKLLAVNGWQLVHDNNDGESYGAQLAWNSSRLGLSWSTLVGPELPGDNSSDRRIHDFVVTGQVSDRLDLAWTYDVVRQDLPLAPSVSWYGGAAYARYRLSETMAISTRFEKFRDPTGSISGTGQVLRGRTVTLEHRASSEVLLKLEWRRDTSSASVFRIEDFPLGTSRYTGEQDLLTVGLVATF